MTTKTKTRKSPRKSAKSAEAKKAEVQGLLTKLEEGIESVRTSEGWTQWLKFQASLYRYSWNNCMLIALQCDNPSIVMGFNAWLDNGRNVRKGEKGLRILAPCFRKVTNEETGEDDKKLVYFRSVSVFDVSQTEGDEIPSPCQKLQGGDEELFNTLKACSERSGVPVRLEAVSGSANGYYDCCGKFIAIEETNSVAQQTKTLAHEIAHSILHSDLSRDEQSRGDRELEAESTAFVVCAHFGLDSSDYSFGYVANWKGDEAKDGLKKSAKRIADAAKKIIEAVESASEEAAEKAA
jgi:antirestriction protein ArdC